MFNLLHDLPLSNGTGVSATEPDLISVEEYHRRIEAGILTKYDKVELIHGRLVEKMPRSALHVTVAELLVERIDGLLPKGWFTRRENPITMSDSEPEPDVFVVRGDRRDYLHRHPQPAELGFVIEVSVSSLGFDRGTKRRLYASVGIPYYWIVNLVDFRIEVHSEPADGEYRQVRNYPQSEAVPMLVDGREIGQIILSEFIGG